MNLNLPKSTSEHVSATSPEVLTSRYYVVFAACNNGEVALVRRNPEILAVEQPVVSTVEIQAAPQVETTPLLQTTSLETANAELGTMARATIRAIYGSQTTPNLNTGQAAEEQYGQPA